jgi:carboxypeptidase D
LKQFWNDNKPALLAYMEEVHKGVKGFVFDSNGKGIEDALIHVEGIDHDVKSASDGDYWRLLLPGTYTLVISKKGYRSESKSVHVREGEDAVQVNITLGSALDDNEWSTKNDFNLDVNLADDKYLSNLELHKNIAALGQANSDIVRVYANVAPDGQRALHFMILADENGEFNSSVRAQIALIGGLRGDEPIGRELLLRLARHLIEGHKANNSRVVKLLKSATIHLIPSVDDLGFLHAKSGECDRTNEVSLEDKFSDIYNGTYGAVEAIKRNFELYKYATALSIEANGLGIRYPSSLSSTGSLETTSISSSLSSLAINMLGKSFMSANKLMSNGTKCEAKKQIEQAKQGSLLDFAYERHETLMMSASISCCSYPFPHQLPILWKDNLETLMKFTENSLQGKN